MSPSEIQAIHTQEVNEDWRNEAGACIAHADVLLNRISDNLDTVPAHSREHAADLLDTTIQLLERINRRFSPI